MCNFTRIDLVNKAELSKEKRAQIKVLHEQGLLQIQISCQLQISQCCVKRHLKWTVDLANYNSHYRCGRPRVTTGQYDRAIRRLAVQCPTMSAGSISSQLPPDITVSIRTIKRRLCDEFKLRSYRPAKKPSLSVKNIRDRLNFCKKYRHWTAEDWSRVFFFR